MSTADGPAAFRTFRVREEAEAFMAELAALGFAPTLEATHKPVSDALIGGIPDYFVVRLAPAEMDPAEQALERSAEGAIRELPADHYLFRFSDEELMDVVLKPDEWNALDRRLARELLAQRGLPVDEAARTAISEARIAELARPARPQTFWVAAGYLTCILGGVAALFIGHHLNTAKKTLPNGDRLYVYRPEDRTHGKRIFFLGAICLAITLTWRFVRLVG